MTVGMIDDRGYPHSIFGLGTVQTAAYTAASAAISNAVGAQTRGVRVQSTTDCHVVIGESPTATTSDTPLTAGVPELFKVRSGLDKIAAIRAAIDGTLTVTELT